MLTACILFADAHAYQSTLSLSATIVQITGDWLIANTCHSPHVFLTAVQTMTSM